MSKPTITHRSALTTTLSAIGVGLMAAADTRPERVAAEQFAVPTARS